MSTTSTEERKTPAPSATMDGVDAKVIHDQAVEAAHAQAEEGAPHMPPPSLSPIILAVGMTLLAFGLVFGPVVIVLGVIGILVGLGTWLYDEIKNASSSSQH